jgi:hypothetical protein
MPNSNDRLSIKLLGLGHAVAEGASAIRTLRWIALVLLIIYLNS